MHPNQLPIPPAAESDAKAIELVRVWAAGGQQQISLATGLWKEPSTWGIMLVDLAKMIADAYFKREGLDAKDTLGMIKSGFDAEWETATANPTGDLVD